MRTTLYFTWLNNLGGFDYWGFTANMDTNVSVEASNEANKNLFAGWPRSYGPDADTVRKQTFRRTRQQVVVRSQNLTKQQAQDLAQIRTSPLVQVLTTRHDRITVLPDNASFVVTKDINKLHTVSFTISFTNTLPTQHT